MASSNKISILQEVDFNLIPTKQLVFPHLTKTQREALSGDQLEIGMIVYETDTGKTWGYRRTSDTDTTLVWKEIGICEAIKIKGVVGGDSTGALSDLPTTGEVGDAYWVGEDGEYTTKSPSQKEKEKANIRDIFVCTVASTSGTTPTVAEWLLLPSGNGRYEEEITGDDATKSFTINHELKTKQVQVSVYDSNGDLVLTGVNVVDEDNIAVNFAKNVATGTKYTVEVLAG